MAIFKKQCTIVHGAASGSGITATASGVHWHVRQLLDEAAWPGQYILRGFAMSTVLRTLPPPEEIGASYDNFKSKHVLTTAFFLV